MMDKKILKFINSQHLSSISIVLDDRSSYSFSAFYAFDEKRLSLIIASSDDTTHIKALKFNDLVSGTIALDTLKIAKIEGVQFCGIMRKADENQSKIYLAKFPYARAMNPKLWNINLEWVKYTNNTLGFGKKLIWQR